ncbi:uncharacterized protein at4g26450 [Phtheirospermum japonicum]|uniref:Uncharacterized protein at4g26450 n=1 Tax=Phtheirospermum japonicum TaxID=374723 RepID=A0A830CEF6_9LAMI|nr:uncharacterized protein at4g26450 [Phtheirospermum japonicum]
MHAKHRNGPGNGYRSNAMGMGSMASASRIPPESAMRGHRMYNSDYRNYNRGGGSYGSGTHSKQQFQQPPPTQRGADVFVDAGKLAAEYLVSKGMLPPNALSGKWQNVGNFPGFRSHEVEMHPDGRGSTHSRLGNAGPDVGPGRRRYSDDHNLIGSRSSVRERKRTGSFKNYGSEANKELGRSGSWAEKANASPSMDVDGDTSVGRRDEKIVEKEGKGGTQNPSPGEIKREVHSEVRIESGSEKSKLVDDSGANNVQPDAPDGEHVKYSDDAEVVKYDNDLQQLSDEDGLTSEDQVDLVKHSKIVNVHVPTKARSSLTTKNSKGEEDPRDKDENIYGGEIPEGSGVHVIDVDVDNSAGNAPSLQNPEFKEPTMDKEPGADDGLSAFGRSNSVVMERGEKRAMDFDTDVKEDVKRLRQWVPVLDAQSDGSTSLSSSMENGSLSQEPRNISPDQKSLDILIFPKDNADSCDLIEEKQLFPGSFKTCDLNLVGNVDVSENHDGGRVLVFPSVMQMGKVETPIDVDLSISNNGNLPSKNGKNVIDANEIEVIDLEKDSAPEDKTFSDSERRGDTVFSDLDGFPSDAHNANGIPDVQDGYGLMMSEFLGHDSPNVPGDLNSLHNHMDLPNGEGILGDDDSIYMSLGEIPISMPRLLGPWEQPPQDYGKPF